VSNERQVEIELLRDRQVTIDGQLRLSGERVSVSASDAKALIADGFAVKASKASEE